MGVPGWPLLACCTASTARNRTVLTQSSSSFESSIFQSPAATAIRPAAFIRPSGPVVRVKRGVDRAGTRRGVRPKEEGRALGLPEVCKASVDHRQASNLRKTAAALQSYLESRDDAGTGD